MKTGRVVMQPFYVGCACMAAGIMGWVIHGYVHPMSDAEAEVVANEEVCKDETPKGYASYPVTRNGELRGCLRVSEDAPPRGRNRPVFVLRERAYQ